MNAPWPLLGIERTDDRQAIRKAYAARLKAIDVEIDPAAFIALRAALEQAQAYAADREWYAANGETPLADDEAQASADPGDEPVLLDEHQVAFDEDWDAGFDFDAEAYVPPMPDPDNERLRRLDHLMFGLGDESPDRDELVAATRDILDQLADAPIDRAGEAEYWLAEAALAAIPRSDPILEMLVDHFGWHKNSGRIDQPFAFEEIARRVGSWGYFDRLGRPDHPLHDAWRDLTRTKQTLGITSFLRRDQVFRLLEKIRTECPEAEAQLEPQRVALWDERLAGGASQFRIGWVFLGIWILYVVVKAFNPPHQPTTPLPPSPVTISSARTPGFIDDRADLRLELEALEGGRLSLGEIGQRNPALFNRLTSEWRAARGLNSERMLRAGVFTALDQAHRASLRVADGDLFDRHWWIFHDKLEWLRPRPADCVSFLRGGPGNHDFPLELEQHAAAVRSELILAAPANPPTRNASSRFTIPPAIFDDARTRAGLSVENMSAALRDTGTAAHRCNAFIALIEAALARPGEGRRMLREVPTGS